MLFISTLTTVVLGAILAQAQDLAAGRYHILTGSQSVRSYPIFLPSTQAPMTASNPISDGLGQWNVSFDGNGAYQIKNVGSNANAYANVLNSVVHAELEKQVSWSIEKGNGASGESGSYVIKIPSQDLVWTIGAPNKSGDSNITLQHSAGSSEQMFMFKPVN